jgi:putative hydrolase of the HAD superfamily
VNFLFDIGNVLLELHFERASRRLFPDPPDDLPQRIGRVEELMIEFETGRIDTGSFVGRAAAAIGLKGREEDFAAAWTDVFEPNRPMWDCVARLAAGGHRLILFSNTNDLHMDYALERYPVFRHFPEAVFSQRVGSMKPEPPIYQHAIGHHGLNPGDTLYIDDKLENIEAGRRFGLDCWHYDLRDHAPFTRWLNKRLASNGS